MDHFQSGNDKYLSFFFLIMFYLLCTVAMLLLFNPIHSEPLTTGIGKNSASQHHAAQEHLIRMAAKRATFFTRAAKAQKKLERTKDNGPPPPQAYAYGDKERTWDNTQALIDWAEGRPHDRVSRRAARVRARSVAEAAALLELTTGSKMDGLAGAGAGSGGGMKNNKMRSDASSTLLRAWRAKIQDKIDMQEEKRRQQVSTEDGVARVQLALGGGGGAPETKTYLAENKKRVDDVVEKLLTSTMKVGQQLQKETRKKEQMITSLLEENSRETTTAATNTLSSGFVSDLGSSAAGAMSSVTSMAGGMMGGECVFFHLCFGYQHQNISTAHLSQMSLIFCLFCLFCLFFCLHKHTIICTELQRWIGSNMYHVFVFYGKNGTKNWLSFTRCSW